MHHSVFKFLNNESEFALFSARKEHKVLEKKVLREVKLNEMWEKLCNGNIVFTFRLLLL
jgi:hypothetical protein